MLARMAKADAKSIMAANFIIKRAEMSELLCERRRRFDEAGLKPASDLTGQPGLALCAATDHDGDGARHCKRGHGLLQRSDIAVDDQSKSNRTPALSYCA